MDKLRKIQMKYTRIFSHYDVPREYIDLICPEKRGDCIYVPTILNSYSDQFLIYDLSNFEVSHPEHPKEFYEIISEENDHLRAVVYEVIEEMFQFLGMKASDNYSFSNAIFQELVQYLLYEFRDNTASLNLYMKRFDIYSTAEMELIARDYKFFKPYLSYKYRDIDFSDFKNSLVASLKESFKIKHDNAVVMNVVSRIRSLDCKNLSEFGVFNLYSVMGVVLNDLMEVDINRIPHTDGELSDFISLSMFIDEISGTIECGSEYFTINNVVKFSGTWKDTASSFFDLMEEENMDLAPFSFLVDFYSKNGLCVYANLIDKVSEKSTRNKFQYMKKSFYEKKITLEPNLIFPLPVDEEMLIGETFISPVRTTRELNELGLEMSNCLHQYKDSLLGEGKKAALFKLFRDDRVKSVVELFYSRELKRWICAQHRGRFNNYPDHTCINAVSQFLVCLNKK